MTEEKSHTLNKKKGFLALSPLLFFIVLYLVTSIVAGDFYKVPITVAFMLSSIYAIIVMYGYPISKRIEIFSHGAGSSDLMLVIMFIGGCVSLMLAGTAWVPEPLRTPGRVFAAVKPETEATLEGEAESAAEGGERAIAPEPPAEDTDAAAIPIAAIAAE